MKEIIDKYGRKITYLRLAVTDKCNMRCQYCLPEKGVKFLPKKELLTYEEMLRICKILKSLGINKIRLTGGEPFLRKDLMYFIKELVQFFPAEKIHATTNGTYIDLHLVELYNIGVRNLNLSLDTLDAKRFNAMTRTDSFNQVMECLDQMLSIGFRVKINTVVLQDKNILDLVPLAKLTLKHSLEVRFIEEMPFNGYGKNYENWQWDFTKIKQHLSEQLENFESLNEKTETARLFQIKGAKGKIGIIPSWTRTICGQCNRMRITPEGRLRTCLYEEGIFQLKHMIRNGATDDQIASSIIEAFQHKAKDGYEAQNKRTLNPDVKESMATIGG